MDWAQVLVIILGVAFAIFLALAIMLIVILIKISRQIRSITSTAERTAQNIEGTVANISRATSPIFLARAVSSFIKKAKK